jgi:hypothetical protein
MKLGDLKAVVCDPLGSWKEVPLAQSPYFKAVSTGDRSHFDEYYERLRQFSPAFEDELDYEGFQALAFTMGTLGARPKKMKSVRVEDGIIYDGQHRLAILLALHGPGYEL